MSQFNDLHNRVTEHAESYAQSKDITLSPTQQTPVNTAWAGKIAQAYDQMEHTPNDPQTKAAYSALISETLDQYHHIRNQGVKFSPIQEGQDNPYSGGSQAMLGDLSQNNHMWFYPSDQGFGSGDQVSDHPLMDKVDTADGPMVANDLFRMVHDYFGHAKEGHQFGANGEEAAWNTHMQMYSPLAQKALTSETRGQNSWVNFGPHGESNRANPQQTVFADQKAGLLPDWTMEKRELMKKTEINSKIRLLRKAPIMSAGDKAEQYFQSLQKSKNVRAERKRIFGESGEPNPDRVKSKDNYRNQIEALKRLASKRYGLELQPSKGKFYDLDRTNKNRKKDGLPPIDDHEIRDSGEYEASDDGLLFRPIEQKSNPKPDWRSGDLEHQRHVGATVHEMSHMEQGKGKLADIQNKMDQGSSVAGSKYGGRSKQMQGEIQPMALENKLRRRAGIPAHGRPQYTDPRTSKEVLTQDAPPRVAVDNNKEYATRVVENDTGKVADLIAQSGNLSPKNLELLDQVDGGERRYTPDQGWSDSDDINAKINQKARIGPRNYFRDKLAAMQNVIQLEAPLMEVDDDAPLEDDNLPMAKNSYFKTQLAKVQLAKQTMTTGPAPEKPVTPPSGTGKGMPAVKPQQPIGSETDAAIKPTPTTDIY